MTSTLDFALRCIASGLSIIPIRTDGSKAPDTTVCPRWTPYQNRLPTENEARNWFGSCVPRGMAVLGGDVSGNLEILDVDRPELVQPYLAAVEDACPGLIRKITNTRTPRPALHLKYRCADAVIPGNTVLAVTRPLPAFDKRTGEPIVDKKGSQVLKPQVLIETRGRHGYALTECSPASCHPSGRLYEHVAGPPLYEVTIISAAERQTLWDCARLFNEFVTGEKPEGKRKATDGLRPGDDFNARATWEHVLEPHGWQRVKNVGGVAHWRRPGKDRGTSATIVQSNTGNELLCCFSSNAWPLQGPSNGKPCTTYTLFGAYATLEHCGDFEIAAGKLAEAGYGKPADGSRASAPSPDDVHLTDLGNARRLVEQHGVDLHYCHPWGCWYCFDGVRWAEDKTGEIERRAKDTVRTLWQDAANAQDADERKRLAQFAALSERAQRIGAMIALARSEQRVPILPEDFDADPWLLNCPTGVVDLRTGELREHRREDLITKLCPTAFDATATSPHFEQFIHSIFAGQQSLIDFTRRLFGYALTGDTREQIFVIAHGGGSNGKSTLLEALLSSFGGDFAMQAVSDLLMVKRSESHPTERADLRGMRLVCCVETADGNTLNEALVKQLTGSDRIRARKVFRDFFEFPPTHKVVLCTNHRPQIKGSDHAIWRRIVLLPFNVRYWDPDKGETGPEELKVDKSLSAKLKAEAPGILAWAVRGCIEWQQHGLQIPTEVREATGKYRADQDRVGQFLTECCITGAADRIRANALYAHYRPWAERRGEFPMSQTKFGEAITERGIEKQSSGGTWYIGIGIRAEGGEL